MHQREELLQENMNLKNIECPKINKRRSDWDFQKCDLPSLYTMGEFSKISISLKADREIFEYLIK